MCLAVISHNHAALADWPVFVAANRDEYFDRPSLPPEVTETAGTRVLAPSDRRAGGTWIGVNAGHVFAVITNRSDLGDVGPPDAPSRGLLVRDVLGAGSLSGSLALLEESAQTPSAPFNLVVGDTSALYLAARNESSLEITKLPSGTHVVSNRGAANDTGVGEVERAGEVWADAMARGADPWQAAPELLSLAEADAAGLPSILKRADGRGTVSSTILALGRNGGARLLHADGPPDVTRYIEHAVPLAVKS